MKIGKIRYIHHEDVKYDYDTKMNTQHLVYSTDWHFGKKGKFRSDNMDEALFNKLQIMENYIIRFKHDYHILQGGDILDVPRINQSEYSTNRGMDIQVIKKLDEFIKLNNISFILGNHDIKHESDWDICCNNSPISFFTNTPFVKQNIELLQKHWKPDYSNDNLEFTSKDKIKIKMTHEPLVKGSCPFQAVQMETYQTEADIVLCADIHTHYGVNQYNNTIFISPGAMTRTNSSEKDKKPYFTHIRINKDVVDVDFIHFLNKNDDPNKYWVMMNDYKMTDRQKKEIENNIGKSIKEDILSIEEIESEKLESIFRAVGKKNNLTEEQIDKLILI